MRWEFVELLEAMLGSWRDAGHSRARVCRGFGRSGPLVPHDRRADRPWRGGIPRPGDAGGRGFAAAGLTPIPLGPKEGLAFINGTQFSTAFALAGLFDGWNAAQSALVTSALSTDAIMGFTAPLQPEIHELRGHAGMIEAAGFMRALLAGSEIRESHMVGDARVQDPYCIRQPQVTGAAMDVLRWAAHTLEIEANAATDNPLVLTGAGLIVSGGNFHAEPVGFAADMIALALQEIGAIAQRRVALMVDPVLSFNLPAFLTPRPGLNSGLMIAEVTTAALMSENKHIAMPCVTDSTPTGQSGGPCQHGCTRCRAFGQDGAEPERDPWGRGDLCRPRHRLPRAVADQRATARLWRACGKMWPHWAMTATLPPICRSGTFDWASAPWHR